MRYIYRNVDYTYKERMLADGRKVGSFNCDDKELLQHVDTISFSDNTIDEMCESIDYYLDNTEKHIKLKELSYAACEDYYNKK